MLNRLNSDYSVSKQTPGLCTYTRIHSHTLAYTITVRLKVKLDITLISCISPVIYVWKNMTEGFIHRCSVLFVLSPVLVFWGILIIGASLDTLSVASSYLDVFPFGEPLWSGILVNSNR